MDYAATPIERHFLLTTPIELTPPLLLARPRTGGYRYSPKNGRVRVRLGRRISGQCSTETVPLRGNRWSARRSTRVTRWPADRASGNVHTDKPMMMRGGTKVSKYERPEDAEESTGRTPHENPLAWREKAAKYKNRQVEILENRPW